jgi:hypothetical protein
MTIQLKPHIPCCMQSLLLLFGISFQALSQNAYEVTNHKFAIHSSVLRLFDLENPAFEIGIEYAPIKNLSVQINGGLIIPKSVALYVLQIDLASNSGYRFESELKYWLTNSSFDKKGSSCFAALEPFYIKNDYRNTGEWHTYDTTNHTDTAAGFYDSYDVHKKLYGLNLLFGYQFHFHSFIFSPSTGIGAVHTWVKRSAKTFPYNSDYDLLALGKEHDAWLLNIVFDFTVGCVF